MNFILNITCTILFISFPIILIFLAVYLRIQEKQEEKRNMKTTYFVIKFDEGKTMESCRYFLTEEEAFEYSNISIEGTYITFPLTAPHLITHTIKS